MNSFENPVLLAFRNRTRYESPELIPVIANAWSTHPVNYWRMHRIDSIVAEPHHFEHAVRVLQRLGAHSWVLAIERELQNEQPHEPDARRVPSSSTQYPARVAAEFREALAAPSGHLLDEVPDAGPDREQGQP